MTLALARKYRPRTFAEVVGQEHVIRALAHALEQNRLHHAYLLTGTRGVGKTTIARIIAKSLNCETGITATPCGVCETCKAIDGGRYVDLLELDAASNTQVDNMRELLENALYAPTAGRFKVYIIDEVHMLSKSAFNAMLKTLEEPPAHVKFVLATTDPQKIPVTVLSRCLQFGLKQMTPQQIRGQLEKVLGLENVEAEGGALALIARAAHGSMRDSLSLLDQAIVHGAGKVEEAGVRDMLGIVDSSYLFTVLELVARNDGAGLMNQADAMDARGLSFETALQDLASLLHRVAMAQVLPEAIPDDEPERERLFALAGALSPEDVQLHYQIALRGRADISLAPDEYAGFTMTLLRMLAFRPDSGDAVAAATPQSAPRPARPPVSTAAPARPAVAQAPAPQASSRSASAPAATLEPAPRSAPTEPARGSGTGATPNSGAAPAGGSAPDLDHLDRDSWPGVVNALKLGGMARMLAQHCALKSREGARLQLAVPAEHKHLLEQGYRDKFATVLQERFPGVRVEFVLGEPDDGDGTLAVRVAKDQEARQRGAVEAIDADPFVRDLVENFDARLVDGSVRPV
ncbi:MAG: DNA polymerase III subunit gamma/tau [Betaproteobacteria bacterium]|nr:DNA polymerase III subunit gamma/tau [Betaproteobacteria bacterium]